MTDLVALVIGVSAYPKLPAAWSVRGDRTVRDAIAVTEALVQRGVDPKKIKLLLSPAAGMPAEVAGVVPERMHRTALEDFLGEQLGRGDFAGDQFFFFCSGHGVAALEHKETLIVSPDSYLMDGKTVFFCLPVEKLQIQLEGMPAFADQIFCINACRTPQEWAMTGEDQVRPVLTLIRARPEKPIPQARFFSAKELTPAPVEELAEGYSNGFAKALVECIGSTVWPPRASDWSWRLEKAWSATDASGVHGGGLKLFKKLDDARYDLDRDKQHTLADTALKLAGKWRDRRDNAGLWQSTLIDLHACPTDRLGMLLQRLERTVFKDAIGKIRLASRWPDRTRSPERRKRDLREQLAFCLVDDSSITEPKDIADELFHLGNGARVTYIEIDGPCDDDKDRPLVEDMVTFWRQIIGAAAKGARSLSHLPILLVGHNNPELTAGTLSTVDTTRFYRDEALTEDNERRLNRIRGPDVHRWLDPIISRENPGRGDVERALARGLGVRFVDDIDARMDHILNFVNQQVS
jgi:hypothetical protein